MAKRVQLCEVNLAKFKNGNWRLGDIVTGENNKQQDASWVKKGEPARAVVRRDRYEPKFMYTVFFRRSGVLHVSRLDKGNTINSATYICQTLEPLVKEIKRDRHASGCRGLIFHHDNARPHTTKAVKALLEAEKFIVMDHPPYSPDLAPSDFWLFDYIKQRLGDHENEESLDAQITEILSGISKEEWIKTFDKWLERMQLCIQFKGAYFEHEMK